MIESSKSELIDAKITIPFKQLTITYDSEKRKTNIIIDGKEFGHGTERICFLYDVLGKTPIELSLQTKVNFHSTSEEPHAILDTRVLLVPANT